MKNERARIVELMQTLPETVEYMLVDGGFSASARPAIQRRCGRAVRAPGMRSAAVASGLPLRRTWP